MLSSALVRLFNPLLCGLTAALAATLLAGAQPAWAEPEAAKAAGAEVREVREVRPDPIMSLLAEKGLLRSPDNAVVQSVRDAASELVLSAMNFLGVPYRRGGTSESGFDCSGFTRHIFEMSLGLVLPRRADEQARSDALLQVQRDELKPGDLVFFNTLRRSFSHVGIYIGEGKFIHSPRAGGSVRIEDMREAYWARRFNGARRSPLVADAQAATRP